MSYGLKRITGPEGEPIALEEAMRHLREFDADQGPYISDFIIPPARERAELATDRQLLTATWRLTLPRFPCGAILLPKGAIQSVTEIAYVDPAGADQVLDPAAYRLHEDREPAEIEPVDYWPTTRPRRRDAVAVTFVAGYGDDPADVPAELRSAMLLVMGHLYQNRQEVVTGTIATSIPQSAADVFERYRVGDVFHSYEEGI